MFLFSIVLLVLGLYFTIFGFRILFNKGFVEKLREKGWKKKNEVFTEKEGYFYDKYGRGIRAFLGGLMFLGFAIYTLLSIYGVM